MDRQEIEKFLKAIIFKNKEEIECRFQGEANISRCIHGEQIEIINEGKDGEQLLIFLDVWLVDVQKIFTGKDKKLKFFNLCFNVSEEKAKIS